MPLIAPDTLRALVADVFMAANMPQPAALQVADVLVWADTRGTASHGVSRVPRYLEFIASAALDPNAVPRLRRLLGGCFAVDGGRAAGPVAMANAVDVAVSIARTQGVAFGAVADTTHVGAIGFYAQRIAEAGCAAIVAAAGIPNMVYHGARSAGVSTSPLAIGIPAAPEPLLLDMATSVAALGRLRQAAADGMIPAGWALTDEGEPTTDPARAALPLPLGGPKGSGLALVFECLSGVLAGTPVLAAMLGQAGETRHRQSAFVAAVSIEAFQPIADYEAAIASLRAAIKALPHAAGVQEIFLPGERGARAANARRRSGIPLSDKSWHALLDAAARLGVSPPTLGATS